MAGAVPDAAGEPAFAPTYRYPADYRESCNALRRLAPGATALLALLRSSKARAAVAAFLDETESFVVRLEHELLDALGTAARPISAVEVIAAVAPGFEPGTRAWIRRSPSRWSGTSRTSCRDASLARCRAVPPPSSRPGPAEPGTSLRRSCSTASIEPSCSPTTGSGSRCCRIGALTSTRSRTCRTGVDVLWKTPWGLHIRADHNAPKGSAEGGSTATREAGRCCSPRAAGLEPSWRRPPYHGEACSLPWAATVATAADGGELVELRVRLADSPLLLERVVSLVPGRGEVVVAERVHERGR